MYATDRRFTENQGLPGEFGIWKHPSRGQEASGNYAVFSES